MTTSGPTSDDDRPEDPATAPPPPTEATLSAAPWSGAGEAGSPPPVVTVPDRPTTYWEPPAADIRPDGTGWRGAGAVVGRTLDTYGSSFGLFLALSLPTAVFSGFSVLAGTNLPALVLVVIFTAIAGVVTGAAMMLATDDMWRGVRPALGELLDRAAGRAPALLLSTIVVALAVAAIVIPVAVVAIVLIVLGASTVAAVEDSSVGAIVILILFLALGAVGAVASFVIFRWSVSGPAIALDGFGPLAGLGRSWALARRHVIGLFGLYFALGLIAALASIGASLLQTYATQRPLAAVGLGVATLLSSPLLAIATAIAYRDLAGRPAAAGSSVAAVAEGGAEDAAEGAAAIEEPAAAVAARLPGRGGRRVSLAAVLGGGLVLGSLGAWSFSASGGLIFAPDRGYVVAGTSTNAIDPCRPSGVKTTFTTSEEIWIAAVFSRHVGPGEEVVVEYLDETGSLGSAPLTAGPEGLDCYYEIDPIRGGAPGTYRIIVRQGSTIIADGSFSIR